MSETHNSGYDILTLGEQDREQLMSSSMRADFEFGSAGTRKHEFVDPRQHLRVENQGSWPSCTGNSLTTCLETIHGWQIGSFSKVQQRSRKFAWLRGQQYYLGRPSLRDGCSLKGVVDAAQIDGCPTEAVCPYDFSSVSLSAAAFADAASFKLGSHCEATSFDQSLDWVDGLGPVLFGTIWTQRMANCRGVLNVGDVKEDGSRGGHCFAGVGFTKDGKMIIANPWGEAWGVNGYAEMEEAAFEYLLSRPYTVIFLLSDVIGVDRAKRTFKLSNW